MRLFEIQIRSTGWKLGFTALARTAFDALESAQQTFGLGVRIAVKPLDSSGSPSAQVFVPGVSQKKALLPILDQEALAHQSADSSARGTKELCTLGLDEAWGRCGINRAIEAGMPENVFLLRGDRRALTHKPPSHTLQIDGQDGTGLLRSAVADFPNEITTAVSAAAGTSTSFRPTTNKGCSSPASSCQPSRACRNSDRSQAMGSYVLPNVSHNGPIRC